MELKAYPRTGTKGLAEQGLIPVVAYNKDQNVSLSVELKAFDRVFRKVSTHGLIELQVEGGETLPVLVKAVQMNKRTRVAMHADFYMVTYGQEIEAPVPIHTTGKAKGVVEGGILDILVHNLNILAPGPRRIPEEIIVDITTLGVGETLLAGDIILPEGCKLAVDKTIPVITILAPQKVKAAEVQA